MKILIEADIFNQDKNIFLNDLKKLVSWNKTNTILSKYYNIVNSVFPKLQNLDTTMLMSDTWIKLHQQAN